MRHCEGADMTRKRTPAAIAVIDPAGAAFIITDELSEQMQLALAEAFSNGQPFHGIDWTGRGWVPTCYWSGRSDGAMPDPMRPDECAVELTEIGEQYVIPGCERHERPKGAQMKLWEG
jgi:hypothetical protein